MWGLYVHSITLCSTVLLLYTPESASFDYCLLLTFFVDIFLCCTVYTVHTPNHVMYSKRQCRSRSLFFPLPPAAGGILKHRKSVSISVV